VKTAWQYIYNHGCTGKQSRPKSERAPVRWWATALVRGV